MKNFNIFRRKSLLFLVLASFLVTQNVNAWIYPAYLYDNWLTNATDVHTVNCDMVNCPVTGEKLRVAAWDDFSSPSTYNAYFTVEYYDHVPGYVVPAIPPCGLCTPGYVMATNTVLSSATITLPANSFSPDVVIADDLTNPGNAYIIAVVYVVPTSGTSAIFLDKYSVAITGSTISVSAISSTQIAGSSTTKAIYPHIDMFADQNSQIAGLPSLHEYAVTWVEYPSNGTFGGGVNAAMDDISTPGIPTTYYTIATMGSAGILPQMPDVATTTDFAGNKTAYITYTYGNDLELAELPWGGMPSITALGTSLPSLRYPRIEAMNIYDGTSSKWTVAAQHQDPITSFSVTHRYTELSSSVIDDIISAPSCSSFSDYMPVVAAGTSPSLVSNIGNTQYTVGWVYDFLYSYITQGVDVSTGNYVSTAYDYSVDKSYISISHTNAIAHMALSSSSNSGEDLYAVWFDGSSLQYRLTMLGSTWEFKPAKGLPTPQQFKMYPNPATDILHITGAEIGSQYTITDVLGKIALQGTIQTTDQAIQINTLAKGIYILNVYTADATMSTNKLVKE